MTLCVIEGRLKSLCIAKDGRLLTHRELDGALARVGGLEQYRLVQETWKSVRLDVSAKTARAGGWCGMRETSFRVCSDRGSTSR